MRGLPVMASALALLVSALPASGAGAVVHVEGFLVEDGWWAERLSLESGLQISFDLRGILHVADRGGAVLALYDAEGKLAAALGFASGEVHPSVVASASVLEPVQVRLPQGAPPEATGVTYDIGFGVAPGTYTLVVAAASDRDFEVSVRAVALGEAVGAPATGTTVTLLGEGDFACALGASVAAPAVAARATVMSGCHAQRQIAGSLLTLFRVREGEMRGAEDAFSLVDPLGATYSSFDDTLLVAGGGGVWEYRVDAHDGLGRSDGAPSVTALVADLALPS